MLFYLHSVQMLFKRKSLPLCKCGVNVKQTSNLRVFCHTFACCHVFALHAKVMYVYFIFGSIANLLFKFMSLLIAQM